MNLLYVDEKGKRSISLTLKDSTLLQASSAAAQGELGTRVERPDKP